MAGDQLVRRGRAVTVTGTVEGDVVQTCVVTLEPFPAHVSEAVEVKFVSPPALPRGAKMPEEPPGHHERQTSLEEPDAIVDGRIDLGALTAEFLALGLDPYPRKPGAAFAFEDAPRGPEGSPFAALGRLKPGEKA